MTILNYVNETALFQATILVSLSCLIFTLAQRHTDRPQNVLYIVMTVSLGLTALSNIIYNCNSGDMAVRRTSLNAALAANYLYFVLHGVLPPLLFYYSLSATRSFQRVRTYMHVLYIMPFAVCELLVLLNPVLHLVWDFDDSSVFVRGVALYIVYASGFFYIVLAMRQFMTQ